ncbi:F-box protein At5g62510-like [Malania oleifera]|uniref:F-box protein At5g62510-like n=1 Tax=Malania oleifera TaxID=397392 RepID=UPI0025AD9DD6|nr:F-box protein At5g62510-like [Malania oleifera]
MCYMSASLKRRSSFSLHFECLQLLSWAAALAPPSPPVLLGIISYAMERKRGNPTSPQQEAKRRVCCKTPLARADDSIPYIPEELVEEILSRAPAESLARFMCVCKSWHSLFSDPFFVKKHLNFAHASRNLA